MEACDKGRWFIGHGKRKQNTNITSETAPHLPSLLSVGLPYSVLASQEPNLQFMAFVIYFRNKS